ncbi:MAG: hypothetical protein KKA81_11280 [Bacteroidetes bacterium]|nr:hypothetical protein [Bacteroidota bacterium]
MKKIIIIGLLLGMIFPLRGISQSFLENGQVHGNFQIDGAYYGEDSKLGITDSSLNGKYFRMNAFGNIAYTNGNFEAGLRFEAYLPPLAGFDPAYEGAGIPYYYVKYKWDKLELTAGNFYEQFGNGLILRAYEEWQLGYDNSIRGFRAKFQPVTGLTLTGLIGTQRYYWEPYQEGNRGIVRGFDADLYLNDLLPFLKGSKTQITLGGSFVSKYEKASKKTISRDSIQDTVVTKYIFSYKIPENVAAYAGRMNLTHGGFNLTAEYAYKINDPSEFNDYIYKEGQALFLSMSYATKGLGISLSGKRTDNMSFKSKRAEIGNVLDINYLPPLTKQHTYSLATIYPYATQPLGEMGIQGQIMYTIPKKSALGGKYGTQIELNYSNIRSIKKEQVSADIPIDSTGTKGYKSPFFTLGDERYYEDFDIVITKKFSSKWKAIVSYINQLYNIAVVEGHAGDPKVHANIGILDITYKITPTKSLRMEAQGLFTDQDRGSWAMGLLEFNIAPKWFFTVMDEYNYSNPDEEMQLHYYSGNIAYVEGATRISIGYGRQREGLLCVGGVCRQVPAANGFNITISSQF